MAPRQLTSPSSELERALRGAPGTRLNNAVLEQLGVATRADGNLDLRALKLVRLGGGHLTHVDLGGSRFSSAGIGPSGVGDQGSIFGRCGFEGACLRESMCRGSYVGCAFSGADFTRATFEGSAVDCDFAGAKLVGALIRGEYRGCVFEGVRGSAMRFEDARLEACVFDDADLARARFDRCSLMDCSFSRARLVGTSVLYSSLRGDDVSELIRAQVAWLCDLVTLRSRLMKGNGEFGVDVGVRRGDQSVPSRVTVRLGPTARRDFAAALLTWILDELRAGREGSSAIVAGDQAIGTATNGVSDAVLQAALSTLEEIGGGP